MLRRILSAATWSLVWTAIVAAQDSSALINKALDEQVKLQVNKEMPRVLEEITRQTGVRLDVEPVVWDLLPWGQDTNIRAQIENKTLREALSLITRKLGLTFELKEEAIQIQPMPALRRLARRSTVQELAALDLLASTPAELGADQLSIKELLDRIDRKLVELKADLAIENRSADAVDQTRRIAVARNATLMGALESLPRQSAASWYPWGKMIVITTKDDRIRAMLGKVITVRFSGTDVTQVLMELASRSGVRFDIQSGAIAQVPAEARNVRALFENASIQQILEAIGGSTGLTWAIKDDAVQISNSSAAAAASREPMIGLLQLDVGLLVTMRQSDVPPDLREYIKHKTAKQLDKMRQMMLDEGFKPSTRPATRPAPPDERL